MPDQVPHIGTLREKPLHASLKRWYATSEDSVEHPVDGFVIDLKRDDLLIEIQTGGFSSMRNKVRTLVADGHRVRIVYPIPQDKRIVKLDGEGNTISRRTSPKHGSPVDVFAELVAFPDLIADPHLEIEVVMTVEDELRQRTASRSWRRKGWSIVERRLVEVKTSIRIRDAQDLLSLLPDELPEEFTTADLATGLSRPRRIAQQVAYCLRKADAIEAVGKQGNAVVYRIAEPS